MKGPLERLLSHFPEARPNRKGWMVRCPCHEDSTPSLSLREGENGQILAHCFAGCSLPDIQQALSGLLPLEESPNWNGRARGYEYPLNNSATLQQFPAKQAATTLDGVDPSCNGHATVQHSEGCTLEMYAEAKRLPLGFLKSLGLQNVHHLDLPAVRIPYLNPEGAEAAVRFRTSLIGGERFRWKSGSKPCLYGLSRLDRAREGNFVLLVEGESDTQTLWLHDVPALGLPGATNWKEAWAEYLEEVPLIYVLIEPDKGGETVLHWLARSAIRERVKLVRFSDAKDVSELYLSDPENFRTRLQEALNAAVPWQEHDKRLREEAHSKALTLCKGLVEKPDIPSLFYHDLIGGGISGEEKNAKLIYLAVTSRFLERPVNVAVKGPSGAGKSYLLEQALRFFPKSAFYALTAMSERALAYSQEPLKHRTLVIIEAAGLQSNFGTYLLRSLLSEGCVRYETVEKTKDGLRPRLIEREGPTGLILTTTAVRLHSENETRMLSVTVADSQDQKMSWSLKPKSARTP